MGISAFSVNLITGHKMIDNQHRKIFNYLESLQDLNKSLKFIEEMEENKKKVEVLIDYFFLHLEEEERLMAEISYEFIEEHIEDHNKLRNKINFLMEKSMDSLYNFIHILCKFFIEDFTEHILFYDKKLAKCINSKMNKGEG